MDGVGCDVQEGCLLFCTALPQRDRAQLHNADAGELALRLRIVGQPSLKCGSLRLCLGHCANVIDDLAMRHAMVNDVHMRLQLVKRHFLQRQRLVAVSSAAHSVGHVVSQPIAD